MRCTIDSRRCSNVSITVTGHVCLRHRSSCSSEYAEEKRTEHSLFVRSGKSEAEVTNDRRLRSTYCNYDRHGASRGLSAIAELLVCIISVQLCLAYCSIRVCSCKVVVHGSCLNF